MKKLFVALLLVMAVCQIHAQQAKYVFYFIGDGMGLNQVTQQRCFWQKLKDA